LFFDAYEDYNCFGEVSFFRRVEGFKMERRAGIKFCEKLKKTATETFEMLKSAYREECYIQIFIKIGYGIQKLIRRDTQTHIQHGDRISLL
jgi:hypothetical protein